MQIAKTPIDRRSARTKAKLQRALMSLILRKRYEAITIKDICDAANVGRSTFYAHYTSKDDLKRRGFEKLHKELVHRQKEVRNSAAHDKDQSLGFSLGMFEHARDHLENYRALVGGRGGDISLGTIRKILSDLVRDELAKAGAKKSADIIPRELVVQYVVGAYMSVLIWWLDEGAKLAPEQMDAMFRRLTIEGITPLRFLKANHIS